MIYILMGSILCSSKSFCSIPPSAVRMKKITKPQNLIGVSQTLCYVRVQPFMCAFFFFLSDPLVTDSLIPQGFAAVQRPQPRRCFAPRRRRRPCGGEGGRGDVRCQGTCPLHAHAIGTHRVPAALNTSLR